MSANATGPPRNPVSRTRKQRFEREPSLAPPANLWNFARLFQLIALNLEVAFDTHVETGII